MLDTGLSSNRAHQLAEAHVATMPNAGKTLLIIFSHGTSRPAHREPCSNNAEGQIPPVLHKLRQVFAKQDVHLSIFSYCSTAVDGAKIGSYIDKRCREIDLLLESFRSYGIRSRNVFLSGQSAGGWASLKCCDRSLDRFNGCIVFAPACCGPRKERQIFPAWLRDVQPAHSSDISRALTNTQRTVLIFAFHHDAFNRPAELRPIVGHHALEVPIECPNAGHQGAYSSCFQGPRILNLITQYMTKSLRAHDAANVTPQGRDDCRP